jgi:hypothetical protein
MMTLRYSFAKGAGLLINYKYYVESYFHISVTEEYSVSFNSFDQAFEWITEKLKGDDKRMARFFTK